MPRSSRLFDSYIMVDWSAGDRRRSGRQDCIWIAHGAASDPSPATISPSSRSEAEQIIRAELRRIASRDRRVLLCADFGYGYPAGFASVLPIADRRDLPPWRMVWRYLREHVRDDLGTAPGRLPTNRSNRFEVASAINSALCDSDSFGPFWCLAHAGGHPWIPQKRPVQPFVCARGSIAALRITDRKAKSDTPFRLFGTGSVGGQVLTGIPRLERVRFDPEFAQCSAVWPFETGWAQSDGWLAPDIRIVHAEIYPSVQRSLPDTIKDRGQVRAMWHWAHDLDTKNLLIEEFVIPPGIVSGSQDDRVIRSEEGWILGCQR